MNDRTVTIEIPLRLGRGGNDRMHWRTKYRQKQAEQTAVTMFLRGTPPTPPLTVTLTRIAPGNGLDPFDNLPASLKASVDAVASWLGVDDKDPCVQYRCRQERGAWGLRIEIEPV